MSNSAIGNREPGADSRGDPRLRPYQFGELRARSPPGAGLIRAAVALLLSSRFPELTVTTEGKDRETAARMAAEQLAGQARQLAEDMAGQAERAQADADTARAALDTGRGEFQARAAELAAAADAAARQARDGIAAAQAERDTAIAAARQRADAAEQAARSAGQETSRAQQGEASALAELEHARAGAARERDQLARSSRAQIAVLESARDDLRARAGRAETDSERARAAAETARAGHSQLRSAAAAFLAACEQALDQPVFRLIEDAAASLRAAAGDLPSPPPAARRGRRHTPYPGEATTIKGRTAATATGHGPGRAETSAALGRRGGAASPGPGSRGDRRAQQSPGDRK